MKKTLLTILLLNLISITLNAQILKIYDNDGSSTEYNLADIEKILPQNIGVEYKMKIYRDSSSSVTIDLSEVDKLEYSEGNFLVYIDGSSTSYTASDITRVVFFDGHEKVVIGEQEWMLYNLDVSHYRNGDAIYHAESNDDWLYAGQNEIGAWCYYDNDASNGAIYGKLYNWYAVNDERGLAPDGYHVASNAEWGEFKGYLENNSKYWCDNDFVNLAKSVASNENWSISEDWTCRVGDDLSANNRSGFTGQPAGFRLNGFLYKTQSTYWWTSTSYFGTYFAYYWDIHYSDHRFFGGTFNKSYGLSVRCIKDD
jgi:uncharacterized protein (TIGR02145 family)